MRHENSRILFEYWNSLRAGRSAPERSAIEPGEIREILGDTFILEVSARLRSISFRLAGTRLCAAYGRELRGLGYLALWSEEDNYDVARLVAQVYQDQAPCVLSYTARTASDQFIEFEGMLLPLMPAADGDQRILGIASPRNVPYWLGADPLISNHLRSGRRLDPELTAPPMAMEIGACAPPPKSPRRFGHLTLLDGGLAGKKLD